MKPQVRGNEKSIIVSVCYQDFLRVSFHCGISHQCPTGSTYWAFVGATHLNIMTIIQSFIASHNYMHVEKQVPHSF